MVRYATHCLAMQTQRLVGFGGQVQVEPQHLLVVRGHEQIVALWMHGHVRDPLAVRQQLLHQLLLHQVIDTNVSLGLQ